MRASRRGIAGCVGLVLSTGLFLPAATAGSATASTAAPPGFSAASERLGRAASVSLRVLAARASLAQRAGATAVPRGPEVAPHEELDHGLAAAGGSTLPPPSPTSDSLVTGTVRQGFTGLDHADQRLAGGGNQFSLEPPDQGLCVGAAAGTTFVVESVNDALQVFDSRSNIVTPPVTLSAFFGLAPTIDRTTGRFGPFISDPKCYFDADTGRWFHTVLVIGQDPVTGAFTREAFTALAVSKTSDPLGEYFQYRIDALDSGHPNCPCLGDQPLIGADRYGFYVSTAEYDLEPFGAHFNGPQLYAMSKAALESGTAGRVVHYSRLTTSSGTLQPATSPAGHYARAQNGTEYLVSGRDTLLPDGRLRPGQVDHVSVWALTQTVRLTHNTGPPPTLSRHEQVTEVYGQPVPMKQRPGPTPLGSHLGDLIPNAQPEPLPRLSANDERVNQVVFAAGHLYTGVNTILAPGPRTGIAWFVIDPSVDAGLLTSSMRSQGYVALAHANVAYPAIGVNASGDGVIAMTLSGPANFPSVAYQAIGAAGTTGPVRIAKSGFRPEDGFSCYKAFGGAGVCRWGDYSASVAGPDGTIWSAAEYISSRSRTLLANWGTFVWRIAP